jgi:hypothetical protein
MPFEGSPDGKRCIEFIKHESWRFWLLSEEDEGARPIRGSTSFDMGIYTDKGIKGRR